jgi:hypothetical protein
MINGAVVKILLTSDQELLSVEEKMINNHFLPREVIWHGGWGFIDTARYSRG